MFIAGLPWALSLVEDLDPLVSSSIVLDGDVGLEAPVIGVEVRTSRRRWSDGVVAVPGLIAISCRSVCSSQCVCGKLSRNKYLIE